MTREDEWDRLGELVTDEVLDSLVPAAPWDELAGVSTTGSANWSTA